MYKRQVTWSPVTYSARAFLAKVGDKDAVMLGAHTHTVFNSPAMPNNDGSTIIQFTGQAATGPLTGWSLEQIPVITTTWAAWEKAHPETEVMSTEGGPEADINAGAMQYALIGSTQEDAVATMSIKLPYATAESTGLPTEERSNGPWLMWAGTAAAHIMFATKPPGVPDEYPGR